MDDTVGGVRLYLLGASIVAVVLGAGFVVAHDVNGAATFTDGFEDGLIDGERWEDTAGAEENDNCGSSSGKRAMWFGGDGERFAETRPIDTSGVPEVSFDLRYGSGGTLCQEASEREEVHLEYTTDDGSSWTTLATYDPSDLGSWGQVNQSLPSQAQASDVKFRWIQPAFEGEAAHWAIDEVVVKCEDDIDDDDVCDAVEADPPRDGDDDDVPDGVEAAICDREDNRELLKLTEQAGTCTSPDDYEPMNSVNLQLPHDVTKGLDEDGDGFPKTATVTYLCVEVDRTDGFEHATTENCGSRTFDVDNVSSGDDQNADVPRTTRDCRTSRITLEGHSEDSDGDGFPDRAPIARGTVCFEARQDNGRVHIDNAETTFRVDVDPYPDDPDRPTNSTVTLGEFGDRFALRDDGDNDTIIHGVDARMTKLTFDRREPANFETQSRWTFVEFDPDDDDRNEPVIALDVDRDDDGVFDAAEPWICDNQVTGVSEDGQCPSHNLDFRPSNLYHRTVS